jgi:hypothetical protein
MTTANASPAHDVTDLGRVLREERNLRHSFEGCESIGCSAEYGNEESRRRQHHRQALAIHRHPPIGAPGLPL